MEYPTGECLSCDKLADEITTLRQRVQELEKEPSVESGGEFKTWWEIALHVGAWKNRLYGISCVIHGL